jgi:ParB family transcriptional regulator, chromosome partitioning protein
LKEHRTLISSARKQDSRLSATGVKVCRKLDRSLRLSEHETALEAGWLLAEMEQRFSYSLDELARRFDRSVSWVSRRLALVELLPEAIQHQVREGKIAAQVAMKFLVPMARQSPEDCQRMAVILAEHHCDTREAGQLWTLFCALWPQGAPFAVEAHC